MSVYFRPLPQAGRPSGPEALPLAGGPLWFDRAERLERGVPPRLVPASEIPEAWRAALTRPRAAMAGLSMDRPRLMGILNVTPDSFSDGGRHAAPDTALAHALAMRDAGADLLDIGGESTRPGALPVPEAEEIARTAPVIAAIRARATLPISIDTRKRVVAEAAVGAGASLVNDVSALGYDEGLAGYCAAAQLPVCLMHAQGDPRTMQDDPHYDDVLLDVYDFLAMRMAAAETAGIARDRLIVDPGIGFGKTVAHNLALIAGLSLFHGLGVPILLGASRKSFIGRITDTPVAAERVAGSVAVALAGAAQGAQILRVHDVAQTGQALAMWQAVHGGPDGS
ncbi:MAG: dihydropteroate synthase [Paracoccaceae bacterium]